MKISQPTKGILFLSIFFILVHLFIVGTSHNVHHKMQTQHHSTFKINNTPRYAIEVVQIDPEFTDHEKFLISEAALEWMHATNNIVKFIFVYDKNLDFKVKIDHKPVIFNIFHLQPIEEDHIIVEYLDSVLPAPVIGFYDNIHIINSLFTTMFIVRVRISSDSEYKAVIMHEMGHSLGLAHSKIADTLMYPSVSGSSDCITMVDLKQFCEKYGCDAEQLNPCFRTEGPVCSDEDSVQP